MLHSRVWRMHAAQYADLQIKQVSLVEIYENDTTGERSEGGARGLE